MAIGSSLKRLAVARGAVEVYCGTPFATIGFVSPVMNCRIVLHTLLTSSALLLASLGQAAKPDPQAILDELTTFYRGLEALSVTTELSIATIGPDGKLKVVEDLMQEVMIDRPSRMKIVSQGDGKFLSASSAFLSGGTAHLGVQNQGIIAADGVTTITSFYQDPRLGYTEEMSGNVFFDQNIALSFLNKLLFEELGKDWDKDLEKKVYLGEETFGTIVTHRLRLTTATMQMGRPMVMDMDLWVLKGEQPYLIKIQPDISNLTAPASQGDPPMKLAMVGLWKHWETDKRYDDSQFTAPKLGKDVKTYPSFEAMVQTQMAQENPALGLTGSQAEDFELLLLDGSTFKLSEHRGKHTVILDFWASWCEPCRDSLPSMIKVLRELDDASVLLLAVNAGETKGVAQHFLDETGLKLTVAMDPNQDVADQFKVKSIPQTVVIGKNGEIMQVHVGYSQDMERDFMFELKAILAEKPDKAGDPKQE